MNTTVLVKKSTYRDSISLMKISTGISKLSGVTQAAVVMATELNRRVLSEAGFKDAAIDLATTNDMIVAIEAKDSESLSAALKETDKMLESGETKSGEKPEPASLDEALEIAPDANLAVISVPGKFAKREAMQALNRGLDVFLFSSNVSQDEEVELKIESQKKGLLFMGPDCGTSIINHKVLGFGNFIREGNIGLVSASGTGLQEVTTLIHKAGLGISHAIGTGGGDLSEKVGGVTMIQGLRLLERDEQTKVIVLISKPAGEVTTRKIIEVASQSRKPIVINFLGAVNEHLITDTLRTAITLEEAARIACELAGGTSQVISGIIPKETVSLALSEHKKLAVSQKHIRGLFAGGTLCYESQIILQPMLGEVFSNAPVKHENIIPGNAVSKNNSCIDMGSEEFVEGRAHPMIDFTLRKMRILQEAKDPETAVILIDVELGYGSNDDPAAQLVPVIEKAKNIAKDAGRNLPIVASVVGTDGDFQGLVKQEQTLSKAGVLILPSNAQATKVAAIIASGEKITAVLSGRLQ
jgi:FdrA protein